jgi:outer membrane protein assembly factor BamB
VWSVPGMSCDGAGFTADRVVGTAWIADGSSLASITREGSISRFEGVDADLVRWDSRNQGVVIANVGGDTLRASRADGTIAWTVKVAGQIHDLEIAGGAGLVVASVGSDAGGEIVVLDGLTGGQVVSHQVPEAVDVSISSDGLSLALLASDAVYFYDLDPNAGLMDLPTTEQVQDMNGASSVAILGVPLVTAAAASAFVD